MLYIPVSFPYHKQKPERVSHMEKLYLKKSQDILMELLAINTCQPQGNEDALADYLIGLFPTGTEYKKLVHSPTRSSLVIRVPGKQHTHALAFVGHMDTVPHGAAENWDYDPTVPTVVGDRIYGRGSSDMKGGAAAMTAAALYLLEQKIVPQRDIYFCYTADEENAGLGAQALCQCECMKNVGEMIIAEPTNGQISLGEKGALWLRASACGVQSHGSRPELGINGIEMLFALQDRIRTCLDMETLHPLLGHSTMTVTNFHGGVSTNVLPARAEMELDIRLIPGSRNEDVADLARREAQKLCQQHPPLTITLEVLNSRPPVAVDKDTPMVQKMLASVRSLGMNDQLRGTIFYTDASQLVPAHHMPFLILGPGDDKLAHQGNEFITISSLRQVTALYIHYILECMD